MLASKTEAGGYKRIVKTRFLLVFAINLLLSIHAFSQPRNCIEIAPNAGFTVRSVTIVARWVPEALKKQITDLIGIGHSFSDSKVSAAQALISQELKAAENRFPPRLAGALAVSFITVDYCAVPDAPGEVAIVFYPRYLRIDLFNIGNNFLPIPRSPKPTFYEKVPPLLLAFAPVIGLNSDRRYGPSVAIQTLTDLFHIPGLSKGSKKLKLNIGAEARRSLTNDFYTLGGNLELLQPIATTTSNGWSIGMNFLTKAQPLGKGKYDYKNVTLQGALQGSAKLPFVKRYLLGGNLSFLNNDFDTLPSKRVQNSERGYGIFLLTDGLINKNFGRVGIWAQSGILKESHTSYQRLSAKIAYGTSIKIKKDAHQTLEIEAAAGAGKAWGAIPTYSQFYAGNTAANFLYQPLTTQMGAMPEGPVIRSLGEKEGNLPVSTGSIKGGTTHWHLNLNFSIPIKRWSQPLVPAIVINETTGATLQTKLKSLAKGSAESGVAIDLIDNKGFPENEQTDSIAEQIVAKEILPMVEFVTDRANVFSFKPVLLFDVAGMGQGGIRQRTWVGAGAGFQVAVVIARLQAGYMHTVSPSSEAAKGAFFLQFVFQNFY